MNGFSDAMVGSVTGRVRPYRLWLFDSSKGRGRGEHNLGWLDGEWWGNMDPLVFRFLPLVLQRSNRGTDGGNSDKYLGYSPRHENTLLVNTQFPQVMNGRWFSQSRGPVKNWDDRAAYLSMLQNQGVGWDGHAAPAPDSDSVVCALKVMRDLAGWIVAQPPRIMIDEDGDVVLTWGNARAGVMVFLTVAPDTLYLHVMDGQETVRSVEYPSPGHADYRSWSLAREIIVSRVP